MDAYLSPEMKSTGEAIGYDKSLKRALYKALQASGIKMKDAAKIDAALSSMKYSGGLSVSSEVQTESRRYFEYEIDF